jgi:two-component system copper resistance phosphate regulon response regulator CusR
MTRVAMVEDDEAIVGFVAKGLRAEGYRVDVFTTGREALLGVDPARSDVDVMILDLGLPEVDGQDLIKVFRQRGGTFPIIVLSARTGVDDKVTALEGGADDYMSKPFHFSELLARVRVALRPAVGSAATTLSAGDLSLDLVSKVATRGHHRIELAPREWALLEMFLRAPDRVFSRTQILSNVWEYSFEPGSNVVDVYVGYLRKKINFPGMSPMIQTVRGVGYRLLSLADVG